ALYTYAVIGTTLYYYNEQKTHIIDILEQAHANKEKSIERFLPWVVLMDNDDQKVAENCTNGLLQVLRQSMESKLKEEIEKHIHNNMAILSRHSIIKELDHDVYDAPDDWLLRYVLDLPERIIERLDKKWMILKQACDTELSTLLNPI
ncbi:unnamed protein product, partial [Adineta ricciae]